MKGGMDDEVEAGRVVGRGICGRHAGTEFGSET